jgi:isoquinoline 1-oxidoreductase beta subunit
VGHSHHAFFTESFLDEAAAAVGRDPLDFRLALLQRHPRHRAVLERAAALAGWRAPLDPAPDGARKARGLALHESFGSIVAQVVEASVGAAGQIRVHRVVCVIDCGFAVNPGLVRQQLEGAIVFGLSAALHGEIVIAGGRVQQTSFRNQDILHMDDCPPIETDILPSDAPPAGVGEAGTPPIAPAVANAWFALTGQRLRALPLKLRPDRPAFAPVAARTCPSGAAMPQLHVNGQPYEVQAEADTPLLWVLRGELKLTGTKYGCGIGYCGACTVHLDGEAVRACETRLENVCDRAVTTIEGLAGHEAEALRRAFLEEDVVQCGYCQGGQLMSACALLKRVPRPTDAQIDEAMAGNLCRCGTYPRIRAAIHRAARQLRG